MSHLHKALLIIITLFVLSCAGVGNVERNDGRGQRSSFCDGKQKQCDRIVKSLHEKKSILNKKGIQEKDMPVAEKNNIAMEQFMASGECLSANERCMKKGVLIPHIKEPVFTDISGKGTLVDEISNGFKSILRGVAK